MIELIKEIEETPDAVFIEPLYDGYKRFRTHHQCAIILFRYCH